MPWFHVEKYDAKHDKWVIDMTYKTQHAAEEHAKHQNIIWHVPVRVRAVIVSGDKPCRMEQVFIIN